MDRKQASYSLIFNVARPKDQLQENKGLNTKYSFYWTWILDCGIIVLPYERKLPSKTCVARKGKNYVYLDREPFTRLHLHSLPSLQYVERIPIKESRVNQKVTIKLSYQNNGKTTFDNTLSPLFSRSF
jgi:hypothetical protein